MLGVIRPTTESIQDYTKTKQVGVLATPGTVLSESYKIEICKFHPEITVFQQACPEWVPLVERNETNSSEAHRVVATDIANILQQHPQIDTLILACTHYPLLLPLIQQYVPPQVQVLAQGELIASSLTDYLKRHPEVERVCSKNSRMQFLTTGTVPDFNQKAEVFFGQKVDAEHLSLSL